MKPNHDFVAERALAQHCAELLPADLPQRDLLEESAGLMQDIAAQLGKEMLAIAQGPELKVSCGQGERSTRKAFVQQMGETAAHSVIGIDGGPSLTFSVQNQCVHMLTDRAYGGTGEVPTDLPPELPLSADLTLRQLQSIWRDAFGRTLQPGSDLQVLRRGSELGRLDPFGEQAICVYFELQVEQEGQDAWAITVSASIADLEHFLSQRPESETSDLAPAHSGDPLGQPFGNIGLEARAVLAEISMPLTRATALKVGDSIPLSISRSVPLLIGTRAVAHGCVGTQNDAVALQINHIS